MLLLLEPIFDDFLNLLLLEADPKILSLQLLSLCAWSLILVPLSGVD